MKYIFILGNNPELSRAEIVAVLPKAKIIDNQPQFLVIDSEKFDCQKIINRLGGTIKIGIVIGQSLNEKAVLGTASTTPIGKRFNFGFSFYGQKPSNVGMKIKGALKEKGVSARLVVSREPTLSSVIVIKEKCHDFLVMPGWFGLTIVVQDFKEYSKRDFNRPAADALSGMLPPKAAKMMINLAQIETDQILLDPFCGSGTILSEALALGYTKIFGTDLSVKAVKDSRANLEWLAKKLKLKDFVPHVNQIDVKELSQVVPTGVNAIITEPYLGKPMRGNEKEDLIKKIIAELEELYFTAFSEFKRVLVPGGKIVIVIPEWHLHDKTYQMNLDLRIKKLGFKRLDDNTLLYKRENQKVWRRIWILEK